MEKYILIIFKSYNKKLIILIEDLRFDILVYVFKFLYLVVVMWNRYLYFLLVGVII